MEAYTGFAFVYDTFMDNVPYDHWSQYLISLLKEYGIDNGLVLELGCGTGNMTGLLSKAGYDMIAVDASEEMLMIAREKAADQGRDILYLLQDMREFELYGTVRAVVSICDSMNYLLESEDLKSTFKLVNNYLDPGGMFIFDMNTCYKYSKLLGDQTVAENREECSFIWDNYYDEDEQINEYELTLFVREDAGEADKLYRKYTETHYQKGYTLAEVQRFLEEAGLEYVAAYDAFTRQPVREDSERMYILARECQKQL